MPRRARRKAGRRLIVSFLKQDLARAWFKRAADEADQRRLAGAVGADQAENLTRCQCEADILECDQSGEISGRVTDLQQGFHNRCLRMFSMK